MSISPRSSIRRQYQNCFEKAKEIYFESVIGEEDISGLSDPFFQMVSCVDEIPKNEVLARSCSPEHFQRVNALFESVKIPMSVRMVYHLLESAQKEFTYADYIWMSIADMEKRQKYYHSANQLKVCDLAYQYAGMGHLNVLAINSESGEFFFRGDGGSNGWDRDHNCQWITSLNPDSLPTDVLFDFDSAMEQARKERSGPFCSANANR